jgi:hypothetical protein
VTAIDELTGDWPREIDYNQLRQRQVGRCWNSLVNSAESS